MRAIIRERYGPPEVVGLRDAPLPEVGERDLLVRVEAVSLNRSDWENLVGSPLYVRTAGVRRPKRPILGTDVAGTVEAVGTAVTRFVPGDRVLADTMYAGSGTLADYARVPESGTVIRLPVGLDAAVAATLPQAALLALQGMRARNAVQPGQRVLVNGAGGGGGTFSVQIAKAMGAEVTAVDRAEKHDMLRSIGSDHVIDFEASDYTRSATRYDRILDFVGSRSVFANRRALAPHGIYMVVGGPVRRLLAAALLGRLVGAPGGRRLGVLVAKPRTDDLEHVAGLVAAGDLRPMIGARYPLERTAEALRVLGAEKALGKLVVTVD